MYGFSSVLITAIISLGMLIIIECGFRIGRSMQAAGKAPPAQNIRAVQTSLLGVLGLLLGFTFSLSLQRFDSRSAAVVDEANAIGTAYLRTQLLSPNLQNEARRRLGHYVDQIVLLGSSKPVNWQKRAALLADANGDLDALWVLARKAVSENPSPVTSGLFVQALNDAIDATGRTEAVFARHVPHLVLYLLFSTILMGGLILGYASGIGGHRTSFAAYILVVLIMVLVFIILDLDRPTQGVIQVDRASLLELQTTMNRPIGPDTAPLSAGR